AAEVLELESCIDGLALLGFDVYTKRQEKNRQARFAQLLPKNKGSNSARRHCYRIEHRNKTLLNRRTSFVKKEFDGNYLAVFEAEMRAGAC
ncbi:MAG: hypothetical protein LAO22_17785, partial [Acidobacteriia bacterium]|nr:hypothetical protein [Terriglobia bacterium]